MANKENQSEKGLGVGKILMIILTVFIITPLLIVSLIYYTNNDFKMQANKYLVQLPGPVGDYFNSYPTKKEVDSQKIAIAKYLVEIDDSRASDKLTLIKNEDEVLYNELIKVMLKLKPNKTQNITSEIRKNLLKKDVLIRTIEQIDEEKKKEVVDLAKYYESLSTITAIGEIKSDLESKKVSYSEMGSIFENMKNENAVKLLRYLEKDIATKIISNFSFDEKKRDINNMLSSIKDNEKKLKNLAEIYSTESPEKLVDIIGNTQTYKLSDLSIIYKALGVKKSAMILAKLDNEEFVHELINTIKEKEILVKGEDLFTEDILRAYKVYRDFDSNVTELTSIYEKMSDAQIAELIKRMIRNSSEPQIYELFNGELLSISDEDLALAMLKKFNERKLASILSTLDTSLSSEITRKLTMPEL
ncbi:hypothetical protein R9X47_02185 [Wukongibacter baidiensis]|uniref:hypothetical protein n=1 Tax=Wukongibacter baidiensis TaxID=1723361 RepID=UPI003D7F36DE